jgi:L-ascorbate metabolism protein UlaG (beta-lactamase superfamily)
MKLTFLGQSGFLIDDGPRVVIDPFLGPLEDPLEAGKFPRLVAPPLEACELRVIDTVLISHHHGDHCHVGTLSTIAANSPKCIFIGPPSVRDRLLSCGFDPARVITPVLPGWVPHGNRRICVLPAAHYEFSSRADVTFDFFGFAVETTAGRIYFAGDTIPYAGQAALVGHLACRIAILPVNGRDQQRERIGIVGNMDVYESAALASAAAVEWVVPCHIGMFSSNTVDAELVRRVLNAECHSCRVWQPTAGLSQRF